MAAAAPPCPVLDLSDSIGLILASVIVASIFYGCSCLQTLVYFVKYPQDGVFHKVMVLSLWIVNTVDQVLICLGIWQYLVTNYANYPFLQAFHLPLPLSTIISSIAAMIVQSFFVYRIYVFSQKKIAFPLVLIPAILTQPVLGTVYLVGSLQNPDLEQFARLNNVTYAANGIAAGIDIAIAISMVTLLAMGRTGFRKTDGMIIRLMVITINTGLWTALLALSVVVLSAAFPGKLTNTAPYFPLCSIYVNTLLANLNSRDYIRNQGRGGNTTGAMSSSRFGGNSTTQPRFDVYVDMNKTQDTLIGQQRLTYQK